MPYHIDIQNATNAEVKIKNKSLIEWAKLTLSSQAIQKAELTIRLVDITEITNLNNTYRKKNTATNVLAFPAAKLPTDIKLKYPLLGDIIICPEVVFDESIKLQKTSTSHFALLVIHGVLHLLGYDHIEEEDAQKMQKIEIELLDKLGFENPYLEDDNEL